MDTGALQIK